MKNSAVTTKVEIEDGIYDAIWGGYILDILNPDKTVLVTVKTHDGVRCISCKEKVRVENGDVEFIN